MSALNDLRLAVRSLGRAPLFSLTVIVLLTIGIGANVMIFSVIDHVLLAPLPFPRGEALVQVWERDARGDRGPLSLHNVVDLGRESRALDGVAAYAYQSLTISGKDGATRVSGLATTTNFFDVLGAKPMKGRGFLEGDDASVVVISTGFWKRQLAERESVLDESLAINGRTVRIVGVADDRGAFGSIDLWVPLPMELDETKRGNHYLFGIARVAADSSMAVAGQEVNAIARRLAERDGQSGDEHGFRLVPLREEWYGQLKVPLYVLFATVAIVLLIVCANIAGLMLARTSSRGREVAIRTALGAGRGHLVRQFMAEGLALALIAGFAGTALASWGVQSIRRAIPASAGEGMGIDATIVGFALLVTLATATVFSLAPLMYTMRTDVMAALRLSGSRRDSGVRAGGRGVFVVFQFSLAVVLLVAGVLLARSLQDLMRVDPGFQPEQMLTMRLALGDDRFEDPLEVARVQRQLLDEIGALASVEAVGVVSDLPFSGSRSSSSFQVVGEEGYRTADRRQASDGYFEAMGMRIVQGRGLRMEDDLSRPRVAVVNETMAASLWPGESAIGKKIVIGNPEEIELEGVPVEREVVGVVTSIVHDRLGAEPAMEFYVSSAQLPSRRLFLAIRSGESAQSLVPAVREAVRRADPRVAVYGFQSMSERLAGSLRRNTIVAWGVGSFSVLALLLSIVGLYGLVSYLVAQRTREFGVRRALGAPTASIVAKVVREGLVLAGLGAVAGVVVSLVLVRFLQGLLFGVRPYDPVTYVVVVATLVIVTATACIIPAMRAASVEVMAALRED